MATILLTGDVMIGRGIDQILPNPLDPILYESFMTSARGYVRLAETRSGPIPRHVSFDYIWGDALEALRRADVTIVNLETALTRSRKAMPGKSIHYRCHPENAPCLSAAAVDCCVLANNHVFDWGEDGLLETVETLERARIPAPGAGRNIDEAEAPAVLPLAGGGRVLVYAAGSPSAGVPSSWAAARNRPGVSLLDNYRQGFLRLASRIATEKNPRDLVIVSIHWGSNWGYDIPEADRKLAHLLIDRANVDIVHGHSSHHPRAVELYKGKPILFGCGDFLNDYEGISGHEEYRSHLVLAYLLSMGPGGRDWDVKMLPFAIKRFRLHQADVRQAEWLRARMDRECRGFGGRVQLEGPMGQAKSYALRLTSQSTI